MTARSASTAPGRSATFADLSGNVFVREWSGRATSTTRANWSEASFRGYSPQIIGGPAGVFVLYQRQHARRRQPLGCAGSSAARRAGGAVLLGRSLAQPAISEDARARIAFAYVDASGVEVRTSTDGVHFSTAAAVGRAAERHDD